MYYNGLYDESPFSITHIDPDSGLDFGPDLDPEDDYDADDDLAEGLGDDDDSDPSDPTDPANASLYFLLREEEGDLF